MTKPLRKSRFLQLEHEGEQVGHGLRVNLLFESFGHERLAGTLDLFDVLPQDGFLSAQRAAERDAGRRFGGDEPGNDTAVVQSDRIFEIVRANFPVWVEN